ncbi:MAG: arginine transport system substrate-binding protein [Candidatus Dependentiae bacterium]|nr:arginine transport system substrate-binding protein [Candidatus Dependentiae bacterium]
MYKKLGLLVLVTAAVAIGYFKLHHASAPNAPIEEVRDTLVVGTNVGYAPFIFTDETGAIVGFDADVAAALAKKLHKKLVIKDMAFDALLLALMHGSIDVIIGGISLTKTRQKTGLMTSYYGDKVDRVACFYRDDRPLTGLTLTEMGERGLHVCTQAGSIFEEILAQHPGIIIKTLPDISDICMEVAHNGSDMGMLDVDSVNSIVKTQKTLRMHEVGVPADQIIDGFGIGITPTKPALREAIVQAIDTLKADGTIANLATHWFTKGH